MNLKKDKVVKIGPICSLKFVHNVAKVCGDAEAVAAHALVARSMDFFFNCINYCIKCCIKFANIVIF